MNTHLSHAYAQTREEDIRRSVLSSRTSDGWHSTGQRLTARLGRTLVHLGSRLLEDRRPVTEIHGHIPRVAA
jgi:hypothetical protein